MRAEFVWRYSHDPLENHTEIPLVVVSAADSHFIYFIFRILKHFAGLRDAIVCQILADGGLHRILEHLAQVALTDGQSRGNGTDVDVLRVMLSDIVNVREFQKLNSLITNAGFSTLDLS